MTSTGLLWYGDRLTAVTEAPPLPRLASPMRAAVWPTKAALACGMQFCAKWLTDWKPASSWSVPAKAETALPEHARDFTTVAVPDAISLMAYVASRLMNCTKPARNRQHDQRRRPMPLPAGLNHDGNARFRPASGIEGRV